MAQTIVSGDRETRIPCPECQGDGTPCLSVHVACPECGRSLPAPERAEPPHVPAAEAPTPE